MRQERTTGPVAPEVVVQADCFGMTIAFTELLTGANEQKINDRLDLFGRIISRQRAKPALVEALIDLRAREERLAGLADERVQLVRKRGEERARLIASYQAQHQVMDRRGDYRPSASQKQNLANFDTETERKLEELKVLAERLPEEIKECEAKVARQRAIIEGTLDRHEVLDAPFAEAAE